jgi:heme oxygenase
MTAGFAADDDPAVLVGRLYVLEGSRCGSIVIARRLARMLPEAPCRFYATAGAHLHWPDVWRLAQRVPEDGFGRAALAAQAAFERFIAHLDHCFAEHRTPPRTRPLPIH